MAAWLPLLRVALPYVSNIVAAALPVFSNLKGQAASTDLVPQQIAELQEAVRNNAEVVRGLAVQLENTITALDAGELDLAQRLTALQVAITQCESMGKLAQEQVTRLEGVATEVQHQSTRFQLQLLTASRREIVIVAIAVVALLISIVALLH